MSNNSLGKKLFNIRLAMGISQIELAEKIGVSNATIQNFEFNSASVRQPVTLRKIISFINEHSDTVNDIELNIQEQSKTDIEALKAKMFHSFILGKRYCIQEGNPSPYEFEFNPLNGKGCIFIYLRKEGKHHVFREERGGWIRTYTDNQLIGKYIKEVNS